MEQIDRAAIKADDGAVYSTPAPGKHPAIIALMIDIGHSTPIRGTQGFVTSLGRFVDRREAAKIAFEARQIKSGEVPVTLYCEDLW